MRLLSALALLTALTSVHAAHAQQCQANLATLRGLAPFSTLTGTSAGIAALEADAKNSALIQTHTSTQPQLQADSGPMEQALRDAFLTLTNATQLADGLGTSLGGAYQKQTVYIEGKDFESSHGPNITDNLGKLFGYSVAFTGGSGGAGKRFFADGTFKCDDPAGAGTVTQAAGIFKQDRGVSDVFGNFYRFPADGPHNPRPFQTASYFAIFSGDDYFGHPTNNVEWLCGRGQTHTPCVKEVPNPDSQSMGMNLQKSPSFPSGHTIYGYTGAVLLGIMVPERYPQEVVRAAEYGNGRIILGAHYAMDVIAGRTVALYDLAHLLSNDPDYVGRTVPRVATIADYKKALDDARTDLRAALQSGTGMSIADAAAKDSSRFADAATNEAFYEFTQTYNLSVVYPAQSGKTEDFAQLAPEAGTLLTAAFPNLTLEQADKILTDTEGPGGGFLDDGKSPLGIYSRIDLYKATLQAQAAK